MFRTLIMVIAIACVFSTTALAGQSGRWHSDTIKGFDRYWTINRDGARVTIFCNDQRPILGTLISFDIDGKPPKPGSLVRIELDRQMVKFRVDERGFIQTDCAACSDSFAYFWHRLRTSAKFAVLFEDDRFAGFSLRGAREILPSNACRTDWEKTRRPT
ncbi:MAG: hypothetical protein JJ902_07785 [Roseibium sp.]|nr:hypothetical protein [Roseibium sp.]